MELGKLEKIKNLREVWPDEARDFTPWLAKEENLEILSKEIGMLNLELINTEEKIGSFFIDILARDVDTNEKVIIENQLEITNHDHLGKLITYASGKDAKTIIWVVKDFKEEHRQAIDYLNENTITGIDFFLLKIELWKIEDSKMAPKFNIISSPNNWTKTIKNTSQNNNESKMDLIKLDYWTQFSEYINENSTIFNPRKATSNSWYNLALGSTLGRISLNIILSQRNIFNQIIVKDKKLFDYLFDQKEDIEEEMGKIFEWNRLDDYKISTIKILYDIDPNNKDNWDYLMKLQLEDSEKFYSIFKDRIQAYKNNN